MIIPVNLDCFRILINLLLPYVELNQHPHNQLESVVVLFSVIIIRKRGREGGGGARIDDLFEIAFKNGARCENNSEKRRLFENSSQKSTYFRKQLSKTEVYRDGGRGGSRPISKK